ncbi:MAG: DUF4124 domain-containing protein [Pseudomonadales bacterium]|nr:DUF4124 domain-containing protein [Pseudomonadales bacterium]
MRHFAKIALILCCMPALMGAEIYRWVDANGVVNYTQQKPLGIPSERVVTGTAGTRRATDQPATPTDPAAPGAAPAPLQNVEQNADLSPAQQDALDALRAAETARQTELANVRAANCERARGVLARLSERGRIRVRDDSGSERMMDEDERQTRIAEAQRGVVENCNEGSG